MSAGIVVAWKRSGKLTMSLFLGNGRHGAAVARNRSMLEKSMLFALSSRLEGFAHPTRLNFAVKELDKKTFLDDFKLRKNTLR